MLLCDCDLTRLSVDPDIMDAKIAYLQRIRDRYARSGGRAEVVLQLDDALDNLREWRKRLDEIKDEIL